MTVFPPLTSGQPSKAEPSISSTNKVINPGMTDRSLLYALPMNSLLTAAELFSAGFSHRTIIHGPPDTSGQRPLGVSAALRSIIPSPFGSALVPYTTVLDDMFLHSKNKVREAENGSSEAKPIEKSDWCYWRY